MRDTKEGILIYDSANKGFDIRFGLEEYYGRLHCGECFEVWAEGKWIPVRIELNYPDKWYLVGLPHIELNGLRIRI